MSCCQDKASVVSAAKLFIQQQASIASRLHAQCKDLSAQLAAVKLSDDMTELEKARADKEALQRQVEALLAQQAQQAKSAQQAAPMALQSEAVDYRAAFMSSGVSRVMFDVRGRFLDANEEFLAGEEHTASDRTRAVMLCRDT